MNKINIVLLIIVFSLVGYIVGYSIGSIVILNWGVEKTLWFLNLKNVSVDINAAMITTGIYQYKNNIGGCMFLNNTK
ncbi:hypothetical protein M0R04_15585 [Candidatus Dojkabacteria bacterium]|jgi:hypothetical protein|nr:hypothetical protein [Candidatus Dojkabacteria bacterium]